jgi:hypothetical protein
VNGNETCSRCKHWNVSEGLTQDRVIVGACMGSFVVRPDHGPTEVRFMRADGVLTCDEGGMTDMLMTGPNFGCLHFERKP